MCPDRRRSDHLLPVVAEPQVAGHRVGNLGTVKECHFLMNIRNKIRVQSAGKLTQSPRQRDKFHYLPFKLAPFMVAG